MAKVAVLYWSGTGNTEKMAETFLEAAKANGAEAELSLQMNFQQTM